MAEAGGSHAQRDLFDQILLDAAIKGGRAASAQQMLELRAHGGPRRCAGQCRACRRVRPTGLTGTRRAGAGACPAHAHPTSCLRPMRGISMSSDATENLFKAIDGRRDELVELTRALIRFPTVNPPGEAYRPCAEIHRRTHARPRVRRRLCACGGHTRRRRRLPAHQCHCAALWDGSGPCVHFNSHIDVVQSGRGWTLDPFAAVVKDGRVYGRGACDMKGGLAASIIAGRGVDRLHRGVAGNARDFQAPSMKSRADTAECTTWQSAAGFLRRAWITSSFPNRSMSIAFASGIAACGGQR